MVTRTVILHYHLFKNAGTSVDKILKDNFGTRWVTREFAGTNNTVRVMDWIKENPEAVSFSSHTMMGPLPKIAGVRIISIMLLRDPVERIRSAYRFERNQMSDNFGAVLARVTDFEGYVRVRLSLPHDRQCRNFQTWRLASMVPGPGPELERAMGALEQLSVVGRVEDFDTSITQLKDQLTDPFPQFKLSGQVHANASKERVQDKKSADLQEFLEKTNADDLALLKSLGT